MNIGKLKSVKNSGKRGVAGDFYNGITYIDNHGDINTLLLTDKEIETGLGRAQKNSEDLPSMGFWDKAYILVFG
tara:strand:- start:31482 stop:31703 length:222 start_codon:yes stop_codon:yes gene_type:complete